MRRAPAPLGYGLAIGSYVAGLGVSVVTDLPSSPVIVWAMAVLGLLLHLTGGKRQRPAPRIELDVAIQRPSDTSDARRPGRITASASSLEPCRRCSSTQPFRIGIAQAVLG